MQNASFAFQTAPSVPITARAPFRSSGESIGPRFDPGGRFSHQPSGLICATPAILRSASYGRGTAANRCYKEWSCRASESGW